MKQFPKFWSEYPDIKFCRIRPGTKRPFEDDWTNNGHTAESIKGFFEKGESYGVLGGVGNLVIIDADEPGVYEKVVELLPTTLTVKTAKGHHSYFFCEELKKKIVMIDENQKHFGEIQSFGAQCIGPGSKHETGVMYEPITTKGLPAAEGDSENTFPKIATISHKQLAEFAKPFSKKVQKDFYFGTDKQAKKVVYEKPKTTFTFEPVPSIGTSSDNNYDFVNVDTDAISIRDIWPAIGWEQTSNGDYLGPHPAPGHGSTTGTNLSIDPVKNIFWCYRCQSGGDAMMALAVDEGIIDCQDAQPGVLEDKDLFQETIEAAKRRGLGLTTEPFKAQRLSEFLDSDSDINATIQKKKVLGQERIVPRMIKDFKNLVKDTRYFVKDFIRPNTLTMLYSPPGQFKSMISLYLALCIADGRPWLDLPVEKNAVLYLDAENPDQTIKERLEGMFSAHNFEDIDIPFYQIGRGTIMDGKKKINVAYVEALKELIREKDIKIMFIDTLHRFCGYDENSADDVNKLYMEVFDPIMELGVSIVFLHHSAKGGGYRGSGDFLGIVDTAYQVTKLSGIDGAAIKGFQLKNEKNRSGEQEMIVGEIEFGKSHDDEDVDTIEVRRREKRKTEDVGLRELEDLQKEQVLECFALGVLHTAADIVLELERRDREIPKSTLQRRLQKLTKDGKLVYNSKNFTYELFDYATMGQKKLT